MLDIRARLAEALNVIKTDIEQRQEIEAEKKARTQYRDDFHLRRHTSTHIQQLQSWRNDDTSDDEYHPDANKKPRPRKGRLGNNDDEGAKKKRTPKRKRPNSSNHDDDAEKSSKKQKMEDKDADRTAAFVTLRFPTPKGRKFLAEKLKEHEDTNINAHLAAQNAAANDEPSGWRAAGGGLHNADKSMAEQMRDYDGILATQDRRNQIEEELLQPRQLRSGKVCAELVSKKRKRVSNDVETRLEEMEDVVEDSRPPALDAHTELSDCSPKRIKREDGEDDEKFLSAGLSRLTTNASHPGQQAPLGPGISAAHPILIESDSSDSDSDNDNTSAQNPSRASAAHATASQILNIRTHFAHPIDFKSDGPCSFHTDYRHAILGHGPVTADHRVHAARPSQLIELGGGHRDTHALPADTMCVACAHGYLRVARCTVHAFTRLSRDANPALRDGGAAYAADLVTRLPRGHRDRDPNPPGPVCSLCPVPAVVKCHAPQPQPQPRDVLLCATPAVGGGCGLRLCAECYALVAGGCAGRMQLADHRVRIRRALRGRRVAPRADLDFHFQDGLVWKAYHVDR